MKQYLQTNTSIGWVNLDIEHKIFFQCYKIEMQNNDRDQEELVLPISMLSM